MTEVTQLAYAAAGVALPLFYLPQIRICLQDSTGLMAFSLRKSFVQFVLRCAMLPFVLAVGNTLMTCIVLLDFASRGCELGAAIVSLRRQGFGWATIGRRCMVGDSAQRAPMAVAGSDSARHRSAW